MVSAVKSIFPVVYLQSFDVPSSVSVSIASLTISPECCRTNHNRNAAPRSHLANPATASLAARPSSVTFKITILVFQCLTGQAPAYLANDCQLTSDVCTRQLRSTDTVMCVIRRFINTFGDRCFASTGPRLWNTLPAHLRQCDSLGRCLHGCSRLICLVLETAAHCDIFVSSAMYKSSYLLTYVNVAFLTPLSAQTTVVYKHDRICTVGKGVAVVYTLELFTT